MNPRDFVDIIRKVVLDTAVPDAISVVSKPPGRNPEKGLVELSAWFTNLPESDRAMIVRLLEMVAHNTALGLLAVLDGARSVDVEPGPRGHFELRYIKGSQEDIVANPESAPLHELL